jgi:hypothetical protein
MEKSLRTEAVSVPTDPQTATYLAYAADDRTRPPWDRDLRTRTDANTDKVDSAARHRSDQS